MKGVVYIDLLIIVVFMVVLISFVSFIAFRARDVIVESKIKEEFELISQQLLTAISRTVELGEKNSIAPKVNETLLLGVFDLQLPQKIVGKNYEIELISGSKIWVNVQNFTFNGEEVNYRSEGPNAKIAMRTLEEPKISLEQSLPNFGIELEGKFKSGMPGVIRYYRYNLDGKIYDAIVLSSHLIVHIEGLS
jgi:hypothetical protein